MADPNKQRQYDRYVKNGMRLIYGNKKAIPALVKSLDGGGQPVAGLAHTLTAIAMRLGDSAKKAGQTFDPDVVLHASGELLEQLADFSKESGGHAYTDDELKLIAKHMVGQAAPQGPPPGPAAAPAAPELMPRGGYGS